MRRLKRAAKDQGFVTGPSYSPKDGEKGLPFPPGRGSTGRSPRSSSQSTTTTTKGKSHGVSGSTTVEASDRMMAQFGKVGGSETSWPALRLHTLGGGGREDHWIYEVLLQHNRDPHQPARPSSFHPFAPDPRQRGSGSQAAGNAPSPACQHSLEHPHISGLAMPKAAVNWPLFEEYFHQRWHRLCATVALPLQKRL